MARRLSTRTIFQAGLLHHHQHQMHGSTYLLTKFAISDSVLYSKSYNGCAIPVIKTRSVGAYTTKRLFGFSPMDLEDGPKATPSTCTWSQPIAS